jgi:hypothetical protein
LIPCPAPCLRSCHKKIRSITNIVKRFTDKFVDPFFVLPLFAIKT